ncbi:hypothetical protein [Ascidiaceihabitans donghaensis]|uniref:hypothetical protein n=1 Tax=Ascidiaceihabitans donghaensis TaxID=1510460 RepID=UPI0015E82422|nr:hypothetical protein [Ascidiaceihabitans donghaensis]
MDTQILVSDQTPTRPNPQHQSNAVDEALLMLCRLMGKQCALDFMRDPDILDEGGSE